jgi:hypothetical protein
MQGLREHIKTYCGAEMICSIAYCRCLIAESRVVLIALHQHERRDGSILHDIDVEAKLPLACSLDHFNLLLL